MLYFAQFAPLSQTYDSSGDGSILISVNGEIHRAYPCFQVGEFDVPSRRFIETYRDKIGIWVTKTDDDKYVYLGFAWKNVNFNDLDSVPTKWMRLVKDTYENLTADYPYVRFKVSEDWLLIRSDGGDVTDFRVNNSFIFLKSASSR
ncbi:MAG: hypothetical protein NZM05_12590 [Chloroherpetonaceae bacterium]|nr:hypothetical protein [Chloroherpetonaceae bacterium]